MTIREREETVSAEILSRAVRIIETASWAYRKDAPISSDTAIAICFIVFSFYLSP
jgi:hypothetical protein